MKVIAIEFEAIVVFGPVGQRPKCQEALARYAEIAARLHSGLPPRPDLESGDARADRSGPTHISDQLTPLEVAGPYLIPTSETPIQ